MIKGEIKCQDFILSVFSTNVAVLCTHEVEVLAQKNKLSFVEILQTFSHLHLDAQIKDPLTTVNNIKKFNLHFTEMKNQCTQPLIAKKLLNESVSKYVTEFNDDNSLTIQNHYTDNYHNVYSQQHLMKSLAESTTQDGLYKIQYPLSTPWFDDYRETFFRVMLCGDHEYLKYFVACIFVVSTNVPDPLVQLESLVKQQHEHQHQTPPSVLTASASATHAGTQSLPPHSQLRGSFHGHNRGGSHSGSSSTGYSNKWFCPNVFHFHVLLHDPKELDDSKAHTLYENMKNMYGSHSCHFLRINDDSVGAAAPPHPENNQVGNDLAKSGDGPHLSSVKEVEDALVEAATSDIPNETDVTHHPLSNNLDGHVASNHVDHDFPATVIRNSTASQPISGNDARHIRNFLAEFCLKGLFPWAERQLRLWNEQLQSKKGIHKSLITATKKWFSSGKPPTSGTAAAQSNSSTSVLYSSESPELQMRHLADLAFLFQCYSLAYSFYHSVKRDFQSDQAWIYYAGAVEMAAICSFMGGSNVANYPFHYMDSAINTYLSVCNLPIFATRATLISTEILKSLGLFADAAMQFVRLTAEESDLRSALFLEQSALCFVKIKNPMIRKYGYHMVLAGNRYFKANPMSFRTHGLRCYGLAWEVYSPVTWLLARDHVAFTLGRHWSMMAVAMATPHVSKLPKSSAPVLAYVERSLKYFVALFGAVSSQTATLQTNFFKEFTAAYNEIKAIYPDYCFDLPIPSIDEQKIRISLPEYFNGVDPCEDKDGLSKESADLERFCYQYVLHDVNRENSTNFSSFYDHSTINDLPAKVFARERFRAEIPFHNSYKIPLIISNLRLIGHFSFVDNGYHPDVIPTRTYPTTFMTDGFKAHQAMEDRVAGLKKAIFQPYRADPAHDNMAESVIVQPMEDIFISPQESKIITFYLEPQSVGHLSIHGIHYNLIFPFVTSSSPQPGYASPSGPESVAQNTLGSFKSSVSFSQVLLCPGRRLNNNVHQFKNPTYSIDRRLDILVRPPLPFVKLSLHNFPKQHLYDGQIIKSSIKGCVSRFPDPPPSSTTRCRLGLIIATDNPLALLPQHSDQPDPHGSKGDGHNLCRARYRILYRRETAPAAATTTTLEDFEAVLGLYNTLQARQFHGSFTVGDDNDKVDKTPDNNFLRCDIIVMSYEIPEASVAPTAPTSNCEVLNYRLHRLSLSVATSPSLGVHGFSHVSKSDLRNTNVMLTFENMTKDSDDKIMEVHVCQIVLVKEPLLFSPCVPSTSQIPKDIKIRPSETLRMCFIGSGSNLNNERSNKKSVNNVKGNNRYTDALTGKFFDDANSLVRKDYLDSMLSFTNQALNAADQRAYHKRVSSIVLWKGLLVDENGSTENIEGIHSTPFNDRYTGPTSLLHSPVDHLDVRHQLVLSKPFHILQLLSYRLECPSTVISRGSPAGPDFQVAIKEDAFSYISHPPVMVDMSLHLHNRSDHLTISLSIRCLNGTEAPAKNLDDVDKYNPGLEPYITDGSRPKHTSSILNPQALSHSMVERGYVWVGTTQSDLSLAPGQLTVVSLRAFFPSGAPGTYQIGDLVITAYLSGPSDHPLKLMGEIYIGPANNPLLPTSTSHKDPAIDYDDAGRITFSEDAYFVQIQQVATPSAMVPVRDRDRKLMTLKGSGGRTGIVYDI